MSSVSADGPCVARGGRVEAGLGEVREDPLLVAVFFLDVLGDAVAQPFEALRQARAARHQQRHGVLDVVVRLGQKRAIAVAAHAAGEAVGDDRRRQQALPIGLGRGTRSSVEKDMNAPCVKR